MSIFGKLVTLFRGTAHEAGEKVVDAKALTILDQEIRDAASQLEKSKVDLARLMGQSKLADNEIAAREQKIAEYGRYIEGALAKGDEPLALQVAEKLAPVETEQTTARTSKTSLDQSIATLRSTIGKTEQRLKQMRAQVDQVKATDTVQRAQAAIAARHAGTNNKMGSALGSLERIKARQAQLGAQMAAAEELEMDAGDGDLNKKLAAAGLLEDSSSASAVLARFKNPQRLAHAPSDLPAGTVQSGDTLIGVLSPRNDTPS
jgi:phage shock protein A